MKERGWVRIVFISSESAIQIPPEMIHYGMTKTAQLAVSRGLAELCAGTGVTVNAVLPGPTHSAGVDESVAQLNGGIPFAEFEKEFFATVRPTSLLKRFATTEEVASLVAYVCSPLASATSGAALRVDGGRDQGVFLIARRCFSNRKPPLSELCMRRSGSTILRPRINVASRIAHDCEICRGRVLRPRRRASKTMAPE